MMFPLVIAAVVGVALCSCIIVSVARSLEGWDDPNTREAGDDDGQG